MSEWNIAPLGKYLDFRNGKTSPSRGEGGEFAVFGSNGVIGFSNETNAQEETIIVGRVGTYCGSLHFSKSPCWVTDNAIICSSPQGEGAFWFFLLTYLDLNNHRSGSGQPLINQSVLRQITLPIPPCSERMAIARILGSLDDKIELNRRMNETLEAMARAIFKDWFVDFGPTRAKMEGRAPYLPEPIWSLFPDAIDPQSGLPIGWEEKSLDQIADFLNGLALQKYPPLESEESLPVIKIAELRSGITVKSGRASSQIPEKYIVQDGDFLFSWSGSLVAKFWTGGKGALNQHLFKVTSANYPKWFYTQWVYEHLESFQHIAASKATTMGHIQRGHLTAAKVICPQSNSMIAMSDLVAPLLDKTIKNDLESRTLAELRDALLPKLMSGEIRVKDAERLVEVVL